MIASTSVLIGAGLQHIISPKRRKMEAEPIPLVCGSCAYLITEEGEPYYCAIKDPYTFVKADDNVCWEFTLPKEKK